MGWEEYYRDVQPYSFREHRLGYRGALDYLTRWNPALLSKQSPKVVLGGFCPQNQTVKEYFDFSTHLLANSTSPELYAIDMNRTAITWVEKPQGVKFVQADLSKLPFAPETIDLMFLDCTTEFMSNDALNRLGKGMARVLTKTGLLVSVYHQSAFKIVDVLFASAVHRGVRHYTRSTAQTRDCLGESVNLCYEAGCQDWSVYVVQAFCRKDACYPRFEGMPFALGD